MTLEEALPYLKKGHVIRMTCSNGKVTELFSHLGELYKNNAIGKNVTISSELFFTDKWEVVHKDRRAA